MTSVFQNSSTVVFDNRTQLLVQRLIDSMVACNDHHWHLQFAFDVLPFVRGDAHDLVGSGGSRSKGDCLATSEVP